MVSEMNSKGSLKCRCNKRKPRGKGKLRRKQCACNIRKSCVHRFPHVKKRLSRRGAISLKKVTPVGHKLELNGRSLRKSNRGRLKSSKNLAFQRNTGRSWRRKKSQYDGLWPLPLSAMCV